MQTNYIQSIPSHNLSPFPQMSKSQMHKISKDQNMGSSQEIFLNDRKIDLNQMRSKISGVQKLLKNRQRQFLSPTYLRGSVGINNPQPKMYNANIGNTSSFKNEQKTHYSQKQLRSSWNDHLLNMFQEKDVNNQQNKSTAINRAVRSKLSREGQKDVCQQKNNKTNGELRMKIQQYENMIEIPFIQGLQTNSKTMPKVPLQKSYQGFKGTSKGCFIEGKQNRQENRVDKIRAHINKSMQVLDLIKNNEAIKSKQIRKSAHLDKSKIKKILFGFQFGQVLGKGKFGQVYLARHIQAGFIAAIKKVEKSKIRQFKMVSQFTKEIRLHNSLDHPKIVKFYGFVEQREDIYLVLEYMNGGTLFDYLNRVGILSIKEAVDFLRDVILGISYLHERSIAHRDIKPQNIVISTEGVAKICDFGWSSVIDSARNTYCGTLDYASPEILQRKEYDLSVDIWSMGILTYEMLMGRAPFEDKDRNLVKERILNVGNVRFNYTPNVPEEAKQFIEALVQKDPSKRPKINQLFSFNLFTNYGSRTAKRPN